MSLKTLVKISSVTNLSDARYCAGMGVEMMGFCFDSQQPEFVSPDKFKEMIGWISGVKIVGEFGHLSAQAIEEMKEQYYFDFIQTENFKDLDAIARLGFPIIFKTKNLDTHIPQDVAFILFENEENMLDINILKLSPKTNVIVGSGIDKDSLEAIMANPNTKGIALRGGEEIRPGFKDYDELADILESLEIDEPYNS